MGSRLRGNDGWGAAPAVGGRGGGEGWVPAPYRGTGQAFRGNDDWGEGMGSRVRGEDDKERRRVFGPAALLFWSMGSRPVSGYGAGFSRE